MASAPPAGVSDDTRAILLLCGSLGQPRQAGPPPLTLGEYNRVAQALKARAARPADLLQPGALATLDVVDVERDRLAALLDRGTALALSVEAWTNRGLWVIGRGDERYPTRLRERLGASAPAVLYGAGDEGLLAGGGLAIVGSREVDAAGLAFTERVARRCATEETSVISGGARGVDEAAMRAALDSGGRVVGVLADSLARSAVARDYRQPLRAGILMLCSPYDPAAGFSVGNAMGRNRHIYALSDAALVVSAADGTGGTWAGAIENLKHGWAPLYVREGANVPDGNRRLVARGGVPLDEGGLPVHGPLLPWLVPSQPPLPPDSVASPPPAVDAPIAPALPTQLALPAGTAER